LTHKTYLKEIKKDLDYLKKNDKQAYEQEEFYLKGTMHKIHARVSEIRRI